MTADIYEKATRRPWTHHHDFSRHSIFADGEGRVVEDVDCGEDAKLIVYAVNNVERLEGLVSDLRSALAIFLGHDERFRVAVGGNPISVDQMLENARALLPTPEPERGIE